MGNAYIMVVLGILFAKGIGFYRDMVFAGEFGTSVEADIYFQVFGLVNLIFTGIGVALSTLVIKNINKPENKGFEREYAARFLRKSMLWLVGTMAAMVILSRFIVPVILPGVEGADFELAVKMMYVMIPSVSFVIVGYIISGILQNEKAYFITSIMSLPFNLIIILAIKFFDCSVLTIGIVTTIGWFLQIVMLLPGFYKKKYSFLAAKSRQIRRNEKNPEIVWIFVSNMMFQLCFYTDRAFVSSNEGMAATFNYASNLFVTVSSVFVVAMSTVMFPSISKNYEEGNVDYVNGVLKYIITVMTAIFLPFVLVVGFFGTDIIRLLYEGGSFDSSATQNVAIVFFIYTLGILGYVSQELFNKILYLAGKYKYTVAGTIAIVLLNAVSNYAVAEFLPARFPVSAPVMTVICTSLWLSVYAVITSVGIKRVVGSYWTKDLLVNLIKIFASGAMAVVVYVVFNTLMPEFTHGYITFIIPVGVCAAMYAIMLYITGMVKQLIRKERA